MKAKKALFSKLVIGAILISALAAPTSIAFAAEGTTTEDLDGTDDPDNITVESGETVTGSVNGGDADDVDPDSAIDNDTIVIEGTVNNNVNGEEGNDTITVEVGATVEGYVFGGDNNCDNSGDDVIVNNGTVGESIYSGDGNDDITNNGTVIYTLIGGEGDDDITNNGTVLVNSMSGGRGNDTLTNNGYVGDDLSGSKGDDIIINTGIVEGNILGQGGDDTITLTGEDVVVNGIIDGGDCEQTVGDTLDFSMSTYNAAQYDAAKTVIALGDDGSFAWGEGALEWRDFEFLLDNLTLLFAAPPAPAPAPAPAAKPAPVYVPRWVLISGEDTILEVYQNDLGNILRFFDLEDDSNTFIAELKESAWENAEAGEVLLDVLSEDLETQLVVTMQEDGTLLVEYFNTSGELLYSEIITP